MAAVIGRLVRGLWSLAWLAVLLVGPPTALVHFIGWPLPRRWPSRDDWQRWVAQPLTPTTLRDTFAVLMWLLWAGLVYALVVEVLTRARRVVGWLRRRRLPPLPTPMQAAASGMLGAAVFSMPTGTGHPPAHPAATPPAAGPLLPAANTPPPAAVQEAGQAAGQAAGQHPPAEPAGDRPAGDQLTPAADHDHHPNASRPFGVELPDGGWVTGHTATAVTSAAALVWLQRRRRYLPRPPAGPARDDADLAGLPATVAAIQDGLHAHLDHEPDRSEPDTGESGTGGRGVGGVPVAAVVADPATVTPAAVGRRGEAPLGPGDLPTGGVGLTGPGAAAAARGVLTAVLVSGGPWHPNDDAQIITTGTDLHALLGDLGDIVGALQATPGLNVADSLDEALQRLDDEASHRAAAFAAYHADTLPSLVAAVFEREADDGPFPPVVLITHRPTDPAAAGRLADILTGTARLGITGVLLGDWPHGACWQVDADGTTHPAGTPTTPGPRLCVLTATATADLLTLLRQARPHRHHLFPDGPPPPPRHHSGPAAGTAAGPAAGRGTVAALSGRPDIASIAGIGDPATDQPMAPALRLRVLGAPAIHRADSNVNGNVTGVTGDGTSVRLPRRASMQILVFLAVHPAGASADELIAALWPGPTPRGRGRLHTPVSDLRTTLREVAGVDVIGYDGDRYRLDGRHVEVDLWRLHTAVRQAAGGLDPAGRRRALRMVVDGYAGELAAGLAWSWLQAPREATRRHVVDAYAALAAEQADPHAALALLQDALRVDPYNEDLHRRAMRAYAAQGDTAGLRRLVGGMRERLAEVDLEPGEFTAELAGRLLRRLDERDRHQRRYPPG